MGFLPIWDENYKQSLELSIWPWDEVVGLTHRYCQIKSSMIVLELGCGAGANIPFFASIGADYYAIEGSAHIVSQLQNSFKSDKIHITCGDFTKSFKFDELIGRVDLIIDRAALTINTTQGIKNAINLVKSYLKPGGKFIGFDWYSLDSDYFKAKDKTTIDSHTFKFNSGLLAGYGNVHGSDEAHIRELFSEFEIEYITKNSKTELIPVPFRRSLFSFVAVKN